jgi:hypothetical protein
VLTGEERRRLKELIEKDELTLEEADELYRIADKLVEECGAESLKCPVLQTVFANIVWNR